MPTVKILYCRTKHWSTPVLRTVMWSPWSHVAIIMGDEDDTVIDATFKAGGVARRRLSEVIVDSSKHEIVPVACPDPQAAYDWARSQLGRPYDTLGVLGIGLHRNWQDEGAWFCSEFAEAGLAAGGNQRFANRYTGRVTPQHSWMLRPDLLMTPDAVY